MDREGGGGVPSAPGEGGQGTRGEGGEEVGGRGRSFLRLWRERGREVG